MGNGNGSGLILPGMPRSGGQGLAALLEHHNAAMRSLTPVQIEAINRIVLATITTMGMISMNAPAEEQAACAKAALIEVLRNEAGGRRLEAPMWPKQAPRMQADDLDALAAQPIGDPDA